MWQCEENDSKQNAFDKRPEGEGSKMFLRIKSLDQAGGRGRRVKWNMHEASNLHGRANQCLDGR